MDLWRMREVYDLGTIRIYRKDFPVIIDVTFVGDFEGRRLQVLLECGWLTCGEASHKDRKSKSRRKKAKKVRAWSPKRLPETVFSAE